MHKAVSVNQTLSDNAIRHAVLMEGFSAREVRAILRLLERDVFPDILKQSGKIGDRLEGVTLTPARRARLEAMLVEMRDIIRGGVTLMHSELRKRLIPLARAEATWAASQLETILPLEIPIAKASPELLRSIVTSRPMQGRFLREWSASVGAETSKRVAAQIRIGVAEGEPSDAIVRRIRGRKATGYTDGVLQATRREAAMVVRTAVNHISNKARSATWEANSDLLDQVQWVSTLDGRTCFPAGTMVELASGDRSPIESIRPGDTVISGTGTPRRVSATRETPCSEWYDIRTADGATVRCTWNHPFWTADGWVRAKDIRQGQMLGAAPMRVVRGGIPDCDGSRPQGRGRLLLSKLPSRRPEGETKPQGRAEGPGKVGDAAMPVLSPGLRRKEDLRRAERYVWAHLLTPMQVSPTGGWLPDRGSDDTVRGLRQDVCRSTKRKRVGQEAVLCGVQEGASETRLRDVRENLRASEVTAPTVLLSPLLPAQQEAEPVRDGGGERVGILRRRFHGGGTDRQQDDTRLSPRRPQHSDRGAGPILAREDPGARPSEKRESEEGWHHGHLGRDGPRGFRETVGQISPTPLPTRWVGVEAVDRVVVDGNCYDIQVEVDHSFLVAEARLIVHNSQICAGLDGQVFPVDSGPRPPAHPNCRSTTVPVVPSISAIGRRYGISLNDIPEGTRASMDGQVAAGTTFGAWLRKQPVDLQNEVLGVAKGKLFRRGVVPIERFVDVKTLKPRSYEELLEIERRIEAAGKQPAA